MLLRFRVRRRRVCLLFLDRLMVYVLSFIPLAYALRELSGVMFIWGFHTLSDAEIFDEVVYAFVVFSGEWVRSCCCVYYVCAGMYAMMNQMSVVVMM